MDVAVVLTVQRPLEGEQGKTTNSRYRSPVSCGTLNMAERMAARLSAQEEQIAALSHEIIRLQESVTCGFDFSTLASGPNLNALRTDNEKLKYRLLHLRRGLRTEQELEDQNQKRAADKDQRQKRADDKSQNQKKPEDKDLNQKRADDKSQNVKKPEDKSQNQKKPEDKDLNQKRAEDKNQNQKRAEDKDLNLKKPEDKNLNQKGAEEKSRNQKRAEDKNRNQKRAEDKEQQQKRAADKDQHQKRAEDKDQHQKRAEDKDQHQKRAEDKDQHQKRAEDKDQHQKRAADKDQHQKRAEDKSQNQKKPEDKSQNQKKPQDKDLNQKRAEEKDLNQKRAEDISPNQKKKEGKSQNQKKPEDKDLNQKKAEDKSQNQKRPEDKKQNQTEEPKEKKVTSSKASAPANQEPKKKKKEVKTEASGELNPWPAFISERLELYDRLKQESDSILSERAASRKSIGVQLPDGRTVPATAWVSSPYQLACNISQGLADNCVIARVNGELWDLDRPLETDCSLELLRFDHEDAQAVYWHSSAHILGEAMERFYGGCLCYGPPIENGFYYDLFLDGQKGVSSTEFSNLENICKSIMKDKQTFERLEVSKETLLDMFKYNKFKCRILNEKVTTPTTTVYRCGPLIDLCRGPHVRHTGKIKALKIYKNSSTYWEGRADMETLQRIYGISFPDSKMLKEWERFQEEAKNRDHRKIGKDQELFFFHDLSPGSCFFLPRGAYIYNTLTEFIRDEYCRRGFQEVASPNIYNSKLWETSGHWHHYSENMFSFPVEQDIFALKPMNCPGHCLMFGHRPRSWRELPLRFADFGVLHRNELSGTLTGLTRVRRFQQDDAHIFCTMDQIESEMKGCLDFLRCVYDVFGFSFQLHLSTRPEKFLGDIAVWNQAEKQLENSLKEFGEPWKLNPGDGAFYGPKIDIKIKDAIGRYHQCATIQLDFQLPIRFNLVYVGKDGDDKARPVIIHRAILGSVERMIAILTENYAGKWPLWLSPRQVMLVPVNPSLEEYAKQVCKRFVEAGFMADADLDSGCLLNKKIRNAQLSQYNFILVVGEKERLTNSVNVRTRDNKVHGELTVEEVMARLTLLKQSRCRNAEEVF
ncbi:threonine--tRNA ligase 1, cytoplasmic isoform X4 [Triplophysa dalaica]|uniref:threonine--tRNA ligase 1, cytoplasmic isoform X4 n=1 Tax=Triplophysa dalaica TaxID=1582913 RepID=UPI0024DFF27C|nr:threonine--tRNA ligase 1, cytoplasmic isoform X4 [Triplophysa dalaica]